MQFLLGIIWLEALVHLASCQESCERLTADVLGSTSEFSQNGLMSEILTPGGDQSAMPPSVMIKAIQLVCESQALQQNRYRYTSVVVSFFCTADDTRVTVCQDNAVLNTQQFDLGCSGDPPTWVETIFSTNNFVQTTGPVATLATPLMSECFVCVNPTLGSMFSFSVDDVHHCLGIFIYI